MGIGNFREFVDFIEVHEVCGLAPDVEIKYAGSLEEGPGRRFFCSECGADFVLDEEGFTAISRLQLIDSKSGPPSSSRRGDH